MIKVSKFIIFITLILLSVFYMTGCVTESAESNLKETSTSEELLENNSEQVSKISKNEGINTKINETMVFPDFGELVINKAEFTDEVNPSNPGAYYNYYKSESSDKEFFHLIGTFKNISDNDIEFGFLEDPIDFKLIYKDKYKYDGFVVIEEDSGEDFSLVEPVEPLTSATLHAIIEIPKEVKESGEVVKALISTNGTIYNLQFEQ